MYCNKAVEGEPEGCYLHCCDSLRLQRRRGHTQCAVRECDGHCTITHLQGNCPSCAPSEVHALAAQCSEPGVRAAEREGEGRDKGALRLQKQ